MLPPHGVFVTEARFQVVYSNEPKLGLTQEFVVLLARMR